MWEVAKRHPGGYVAPRNGGSLSVDMMGRLKESINTIAPSVGRFLFFVVGKREKRSRGIWRIPEQREKLTARGQS